MTATPTEMDVQQIPIDKIDPPQLNSRLPKWGAALTRDQQQFEDLKADIKRRGLIQPVIVHINGDRFILGPGWRRWTACRELEWETIPAVVKTTPPSFEENLAENLRRKNLTSYEEANACLVLREEGKNSDQIAAIMGEGFSSSRVRNLCVTVAKLAPPIKQDWEQDHPAVNAEFLRELATPAKYPTQDDQVKAWESRKTAFEKAAVAGEKAPRTAKRKGGHETEKKPETIAMDAGRVTAVYAAAKKTKSLIVLEVLNYISGSTDVPPRTLPLKKEKAAKKDNR